MPASRPFDPHVAAIVCVAFGLLLSGCGEQDTKLEKSLAQIKYLGGKVTTAPNLPGDPVINIDADTRKLGDQMVAPLGQLTDLQELNLHQTLITDKGIASLKDLGRLRVLTLSANRISDSGLESLKNLKSLQVLALSRTDITDAGLPALYGLTQLQTIYLSHTRVTPEGIKKLQDALPLARIVTD
jgi:Leucine-rich repeat (LRR) protein